MPAEITPTASVDATHVCTACGQRVVSEDDRKRKRFLVGVALAWLPFLPVMAGLFKAFRGISEQKATGLGGVAGGAAEMGIICFVVFAPVYLLSAIVLLLRSFSKAHPARAVVATISICWNMLLTGVLALWFWLVFVVMPRP